MDALINLILGVMLALFVIAAFGDVFTDALRDARTAFADGDYVDGLFNLACALLFAIPIVAIIGTSFQDALR